MKKILKRIKLSMLSTFPKQILKIVLYVILFVGFLSSLLVDKLSDYFIGFAEDKLNYDIIINSQNSTNEVENSYNFYHDRGYALNYLDETIDFVQTIDDIENNDDCICDIAITYDLLSFKQDNKQFYNGESIDFSDTDKQYIWESYQGFDCISVSNKTFQNIGSLDNVKYDNYVCLLHKDAFIYDEMDMENPIKKIEIGDKINLKQIIGNYQGDTDVVFTVVGFIEDDLYLSGSVKQMYIPLNNFIKLLSETKQIVKDNADIKLQYPCKIREDIVIKCDDLNQFINVKNEIDNEKNLNIFYISDVLDAAQMIAMASAIGTNMNDLIFIMMLLIVLTTVVIAILNMFMRRKEIGLLSSFGESKKNICIQIIMEQMIIILFAMFFSINIGRRISVKLLTYLMTNNSFELFNQNKIFFSQNINIKFILSDYINLAILVIISLIVYTIVADMAIKRNDPKKLLEG